MSYVGYLVRRGIQSIPVLFGLSILIFFITRVVPGSPVRLALGPNAGEEQVEALRTKMGLDQPIPIQYADWLTGALTGDLGMSLRTDNNVFTDIVVRLPATIELVLVAMLFALLIGIPLGVISGTNKDHWPDHVSRISAITGLSLPRFYVGIVLQLILVGWLGLFPLTGRLSPELTPPPQVTGLYLFDSIITMKLNVFVDAVWHIILPAFALGLSTLAQVMRLLRSDMIEENREDYILAARAYGLPKNLIQYKYMLRNAFSSSLTIVGLAFAFLLGNAFLIEMVFAWPGMARYGVQAIISQDFNAIVGIVMIVGLAFVLVNLLVDMLYGVLDPRVRLDKGGD